MTVARHLVQAAAEARPGLSPSVGDAPGLKLPLKLVEQVVERLRLAAIDADVLAAKPVNLEDQPAVLVVGPHLGGKPLLVDLDESGVAPELAPGPAVDPHFLDLDREIDAPACVVDATGSCQRPKNHLQAGVERGGMEVVVLQIRNECIGEHDLAECLAVADPEPLDSLEGRAVIQADLLEPFVARGARKLADAAILDRDRRE